MQNKLIKISFGVLILGLFGSCAAVKNLIPKEKTPFQERKFDSKLWREGDAQTRGEMSDDLRWKKSQSNGYFLDSKTQSEILEILGEPDRKTRGKCCGAGGTSDEEVWLYNIEVKGSGNSKFNNEHFQLYFTPSGKLDEIRISLWDDNNPDYFPRVG
jgi:hypothetical protein